MLLESKFYQRNDVVKIAQELLGKCLYSRINGVITSGMIVETEAYSWRERGCHAYASKRTARTEIMFKAGGHAYIYLCYGMHHLFNIVTNVENVAEAVLIRALEPLEGLDHMQERRGKRVSQKDLTSGPGKLTKAMGIDRTLNGIFLQNDKIWVEKGERISAGSIEVSARIGIDYAGEDARLPWRFTIKHNPWVSKLSTKK